MEEIRRRNRDGQYGPLRRLRVPDGRGGHVPCHCAEGRLGHRQHGEAGESSSGDEDGGSRGDRHPSEHLPGPRGAEARHGHDEARPRALRIHEYGRRCVGRRVRRSTKVRRLGDARRDGGRGPERGLGDGASLRPWSRRGSDDGASGSGRRGSLQALRHGPVGRDQRRDPPHRGRLGRRTGGHRTPGEGRHPCEGHWPIHEKGPSLPGSWKTLPPRGPRSVLGRLQPRPHRGDLLTPNPPRGQRLGGVYLVASAQKPVTRLLATVTAALEGGISAVQLREKGAYSPEEQIAAGRGLRELLHGFYVPLLVDDDPELARRLHADGGHVGRDDPSPRIAPAILGLKAIIGVTLYGNPGEESSAAESGADYLACGPFFPSPTKPDEPVLPLHTLDAVVHRSTLPVFAIGGGDAEKPRLPARPPAARPAVGSALIDAPGPPHATEAVPRAVSGGSRTGRVRRPR